MNQQATPPTDVVEEAAPPPFDPGVVEGLLRQLDKTLRAHQLYEGNRNNPSYAKALEAGRAAFAPVWAETDTLTLQVSDRDFTWAGVSVHAQEEKASDSLPWTMYKDGVREITITAGFEQAELDQLLEVLRRTRHAQALDDDLLTMLWEQEFTHFTYKHVELALEGVPIDPAAEAGRWPAQPGKPVEDVRGAVDEARAETEDTAQDAAGGGGGSAAAAPPPPGVVRMEDFDSSLYFLEESEVRYLRAELDQEYAADLRRLVLDSLLDIFELQTDPLVRKEVVAHLDSLTLHLLAGRQFGNVAYLLRETAATLERARDVTPEMHEHVRGLSDRLSEAGSLTQLLQALDESDTLPPSDDLEELFRQLRPSALGTIFAWLAQSQNARLRPPLEAAADRLAASNTGEVVRLIASAEPTVSLEAVRRAGALRSAAAVPALGKIVADGARDVRLAAVTALTDIGSPGALQAIEKAIDDADRDVRIAAMRALAARAHRPALPKVTQAIKSKEIRSADRTERLALFELFGLLCGDGGVAYLDELLNSKGGLFARKEDPELRACAAVALGKIGTARAGDALRKASDEKDVIVRSAVSRALREIKA